MDCEVIKKSLKLDLEDKKREQQVLESLKDFFITKKNLEDMKEIFLKEMEAGLRKDRKESSLLMLNTFITDMPNGKEKGHFLGIDLGSTNFRVVLANFDEIEFKPQVEFFPIDESLRKSSNERLFGYMADCIETFISHRPELKKEELELGFTFSFPMHTTSVDRGELDCWTSTFDIPETIGLDAAILLQNQLDKRKLNVRVTSLLNDASATCIKGMYTDENCAIGMIAGTGFNCCYIERPNRMPNYNPEASQHIENVLVNCESGAFGDNGCIDKWKTEIDFNLDAESLFPKSFSFEKLFSGNFMGGILRRTILKLVKENLLFNGLVKEILTKRSTVKSVEVSLIESDKDDYKNTINFIESSLGYDKYDKEDVKIVRFLGALLSARGAAFCALQLSTLIERIGRDYVTIGIDGSFYEKHPTFKTYLTNIIETITHNNKFDHFLANDASGIGAAIVSAAIKRARLDRQSSL